jgi:glutamate/tyrosine decarboxylase-like PLP-dependent enzyme
MVHHHVSGEEILAPARAVRMSRSPIPKNRIPDGESSTAAVYRTIHDELSLDGSSRLNTATFVTTWIEPEAEQLGRWRVATAPQAVQRRRICRYVSRERSADETE